MQNILIVENSSLIIRLLKDLFAQNNHFNIFIAKSSKEANHLIKQHHFFVSISNIVLPDSLDGEIIHLFDEHNIPNIVLTSNVDKDNLEMINKINVVDYILKTSIHELTKAYDLVELLLAIEGREVLVVEDSVLSATQVKNTLESLLLNVHLCKNGKEALSLLEKNGAISMVITDYNMAQMNGLELLKHLRKEDKYAHIPILAISSNYDNDLKVQLYKNGVTDFLQKPILLEELKSKVVNIYSKIKQMDDINLYNIIFDENVISSTADTKGIITNVSQAFCNIAGYSKEELIGQPHNIVRHPDMPKSIFKEIWSTIQSGKTWKGEVKNLHKNGGFYWVKAVIEPNFNSKGDIQSFTSIRQDITDKKRIYELSITDGLTSLFNRRYFNDIVPEMLSKTVRNNEVFAFILLDIDNFKKYNDTYGHQEGDSVLINVSKSLKESFRRDDDMVFRLGGEEFGIVINAKKQEDILQRAQIARQNIQDLNIEHKKNPALVITASFGYTTLNKQNDAISIECIYKKADDALYKAKEGGRNKVEYLEI